MIILRNKIKIFKENLITLLCFICKCNFSQNHIYYNSHIYRMKASQFGYQNRYSPSQDSRFLEALSYNYAKVDEKTFDELLLFCSNIAQYIKYYNTQNQVDGTWIEFFTDELMVLANIRQIKLNDIEIDFKQNIDKALKFNRPEKKKHYLNQCFEKIYQMANLFKDWLLQLKSVEEFANAESNLRNDIFNALDSKLAPAFHTLEVLDNLLLEDEPLDWKKHTFFTEFSRFWFLQDDSPNIELDNRNTYFRVQHTCEFLEKIFQAFYETLIYLKNKAEDYLKDSLNTDTHYPDMALLIGFLQLYKMQQNNLNTTTKRYLDFYYREILKQYNLPAKSNKVYVKFEVNDNAMFARIEKGERLSAGEYENGNNIVYITDTDLEVNKVKIEQINTIFASYKEISIKGVYQRVLSQLFAQNIALPDVTPIPNAQQKRTFATFGELPSAKNIGKNLIEPGKLGFALASPAFVLGEGRRQISLLLKFEPNSYETLKKWVIDLSLSYNETEDEIFIKIFLEAFFISITTPEGWHDITKYVVTRNNLKHQLEIKFDIESTEPAFVTYNKEIHKGNFVSDFPIVRFLLNNQSYIYAYTLMRQLDIKRIDIKTKVEGIKSVKLYSEFGVLNADSPFFPFGSTPHVGSYLLIGKNEIFQKSLKNLDIEIEWFNLPKNINGFGDYYIDYRLDLDNTSFEIDISVLNRGIWFPEKAEERQKFKLFRTTDNPKNTTPQPLATLHPITALDNIDITSLKLPHNYLALHDELKYTNTTQRGFIKLELVAPNDAFGHQVYGSVLSDAMLENAKTSVVQSVKGVFGAKKEVRGNPNQPYSPQMKAITLGYESSSIIDFTDRSKKNDKTDTRGQFFHLHPFGENLIYPDSNKQQTMLLPDFDVEGSLLLGLNHVNAPQVITMLFELAEGVGISSEEQRPEIEWSYLVDDEWKILSRGKVLRDDTENFIKTGIISIELPFDIKKGNSILDADLYWLRVSVIQNINASARLNTICTQVLTATWEFVHEEQAFLKKKLPAFTISNSEENIQGIQSITQPMPSFGGIPAEEDRSFYVRVSERLRHKQRAITAWDYERLILEKFPQVYKATCLPNMTSNNLQASGSVLIIVTPRINIENQQNLEPQVSSEVLYEIKSYMQQFVSPFVKLEIRNPSYEKVKIICDVKLTRGYNYLQQLNEDINTYLTASMIGNRKTVELGGRINSSDILSFMRTLNYIDFITKFSMLQTAQDFRGQYQLHDTANLENPTSFLQGTKPWSVLIPALEHQINILDEKNEILPMQAGIGNLEVSMDFIVA